MTNIQDFTTTLAESGLSGSGGKSKRLNLLMYGPFGTWKTVSAHHLTRTRTLDFDDGMQSVEWAIKAGIIDRRLEDLVYATIKAPPTMDMSKNNVFDLAADQIELWLEQEDIAAEDWDKPYPQMWDTLIIDSGTGLMDGTLVKALKENNRLGLSKSWEQRKARGLTPTMIQDYGAAGQLFRKFMSMCYGLGKNIVLVCHDYHNTDKKGALLSIDPALVGQLRTQVPKDFDEVWYCKVKGTPAKSKGVFQTQPDPMRRCRSRLGCLDHEETADFPAIREKIAEFYGVGADEVWSAYHGIEGAEQAMKEELASSNSV